MELPPQEFQANIVDYYENMRDSHWNPRFIHLCLDLAGRLLNVRAACTSLSVDRWPDAQLTLLTDTPTGAPSQTVTNTNNTQPTADSNLVTFQLLKHILANSIPIESVFGDLRSVEAHCLQTWPQHQHYFAKLRSLIITSQKPLPSIIPTMYAPSLVNPLATLLLPTPTGPFLFPQLSLPMPFSFENYLYSASQAMIPPTGNFVNGLMALAAATAMAPRFPLMPMSSTQTDGIQSILAPTQAASPNPMLSPCDYAGVPKGMFAQLQVVCFRDEAKTRFMCSKCNKQWTSMKGAITFIVIISHQLIDVPLMHWIIRPGANVLFELFPQACGDCSVNGDAGPLCAPKWYPEEVDKVLRNLFVNIHRTFYKNVITWEQQFDRRRRPGNPTGRHDNTKCIACLNGMCVSALGQPSSSQPMTTTNESVDRGSQSEWSPACKRRLVPPPDASHH